jgi:DNA-binding PadR family transcriptional regulator
MTAADIERETQKGGSELIVLALLEGRARHGYEIAKLIESESGSKVQFHVASLYPMLYRLERKKLVEGRWVEKAGERRRRFYRLTPEGRRALARQRRSWREFFNALNRLTGFSHA